MLIVKNTIRVVMKKFQEYLKNQLQIHVSAETWKKQKKKIFIEIKKRTISPWVDILSHSNKGTWTRRVIPDVAVLVGRRHGELNYHLTLAFSGHGYFNEFLFKIGKTFHSGCTYCKD